MSKNDILRLCTVITLISLSICLLAVSFSFVARVFVPQRIQIDSQYLHDEIVGAMITSGVAEDLEDIKRATN
jgi:hypothetical protein